MYTSGVLEICEVENNRIVRTRCSGVRFQEKTVGVTRFWSAQVASYKVDRLIALPWIPQLQIQQSDIALILGEQFGIVQIQRKEDVALSVLLSLERLGILKKDERPKGGAGDVGTDQS